MTTSTTPSAGWRTVDIVVAAAVAAAFGVAFVAWNALWAVATPIFTVLPPAQAILYGFWLVPGVLVGLIVRKPGAALFAGILSASVSALIGSQWGLDTIVSGALQGGGAELAFALGGYRRWSLPVAILAAVISGVGAAIHDVVVYWWDLGPGFWAIFGVTLVASGVVVAGIGAWLLVGALVRTGVLSSFAVGREQPEV